QPRFQTGGELYHQSCTIERAVTTPGTDRSQISKAKTMAQAAVAAARDDLIEISREIHANPELAMEEKLASGLLADRLEKRGFAVERGAFGLDTAFRARWGEGPVTLAYLC